MIGVPVEAGLTIACIMFGIGITGLIVRRNMFFMLISLQIMLNASGFAFVFASSNWRQQDGQFIMVLMLLIGFAEALLGLALIYKLYKYRGHADVVKPFQQNT